MDDQAGAGRGRTARRDQTGAPAGSQMGTSQLNGASGHRQPSLKPINQANFSGGQQDLHAGRQSPFVRRASPIERPGRPWAVLDGCETNASAATARKLSDAAPGAGRSRLLRAKKNAYRGADRRTLSPAQYSAPLPAERGDVFSFRQKQLTNTEQESFSGAHHHQAEGVDGDASADAGGLIANAGQRGSTRSRAAELGFQLAESG